MRYHLRTLMIVLALRPPVLAGAWWLKSSTVTITARDEWTGALFSKTTYRRAWTGQLYESEVVRYHRDGKVASVQRGK